MSSEGTIVTVGLPASGKTTFLAALWHQVESAEIPTAFTAERLQPDREYFNKIRGAWLAFEEIPRTPVGIERSALLHLRHTRTGTQFDLSIPDAAGERFADQWYSRRIPRNYVEQLRASFGLCLFVHPNNIVRAELTPATKPQEDSLRPDLVDWEPGLTPTQVRFVDLLQNALRIFAREREMRVAVVVSAWDEVDEQSSPAAWLERSLPMLDQFLRANVGELAYRVYGVSAIGGKLEDSERLALTPSPSSRVRVHIDSEMQRDLTLPLEFLTETESPT